jgi:hypothetical protein
MKLCFVLILTVTILGGGDDKMAQCMLASLS